MTVIPTDAISFLKDKFGSAFRPEWTLILGSGLESVAADAKDAVTVPYSGIPGFSAPTVAGHAGKLTACDLFGKKILVFSGRFHYYEGHPMEKVVLPVRLAFLLGCKKLILTAAVGGINKKFRPGDIVIVKDHMNFMGENPLRGPHVPAFGERFPDFGEVYSKRLRETALKIAKRAGLRAFPGIYAAMSGPSYETPAEVAALAKLGGDIVGMSVVPEAAAARQMGMEVLALCFVANRAAGLSKTPLRHDEVLACGKSAAGGIATLVREILCSSPN